jgi:PAS domain S-box-containing protein
MTNKDNQTEEAAELLKRAEGIAWENVAQLPESFEALSPGETRQTLHELRLYKIELERQNEELRRTQAELDAVRARYFDLYDLAPVGYCTVSEQGLILEANLTAANLLGTTRGSLVSQPISRFILPEDQDIHYGHRKQLFASVEPQIFDLRMAKIDGATFWASLEVTDAQDKAGAPFCRIVFSEINKRKQMEEALKESEDRFRTIFEQAGVGVALVNTKTGQIIRINQKYCDFVGYTVQEMLQKTFMDISYYQDIQENADKNRQLIDGDNREYTFEKRYLHKE